MKYRLAFSTLLLLALAAATQAAAVAPDATARIDELENKLIAPCCWSEPIAFHRSQVALDMKLEVRQMVEQGQTDREILDYYIAEYGPRILIEPEGTLATWMNVVPVIAVAFGLVVVVLVIRRLARPPLPSST